jgi:hypothetical protein
MEVSEVRRLKQLEDENAKLKRLLAESMMDVSTLREMLGKTSEARGKEVRRVLGHDREALFAATCQAGDCDQHLVTVLGNVNAYQNTGIRSMLSLGHSRSPLCCGSQNHHRDPGPGYGRPLRV